MNLFITLQLVFLLSFLSSSHNQIIKAESDYEKDEVKLFEIDHKRDCIWNQVNSKRGIESIN
jgi:hypothetical protein